MYKLIGTLILLAVSLLYGRRKIFYERQKIKEGEAICDLTEYISEQIEYTMKPLPEIIAGYRNEILAENGFLESAAAEGMEKAWEVCSDGFRLPSGGIHDIFGEFCRSIGKGYRKEELELCGLTQKHLKAELEKLKEDSVNREKLYRSLPPLMVLSVVLILL